MKRKKLLRLLESEGYYFKRNGGNHDIYAKGEKRIPIPRHSEINERLAQSIIQQVKNKVSEE